MGHELRVVPVGRLVLQVEDLAGLRQPKTATMRSSLPSPLKSAACTSATRPTPSSRVIGVKVPSALPRSQTTLPTGRSVGVEAAEVGDDDVLDAVAVEIDHLGVGRVL